MTASAMASGVTDGRHPGTGAALAAAALGTAFAAVSAYWALGGPLLLDTVGGALEARGQAGDPALIALVWVTVGLKLAAAVLGVATVRRWSAGLASRLVRIAAWTAAVILTTYGAVLTVVGLLVVFGVIAASPTADLHAIRWHAFLWDPWFLAWGVLLLIALVRSTKSWRRPAGAPRGLPIDPR